MKRAVKNNTSPEEVRQKPRKRDSAKVSKPEKPAALKIEPAATVKLVKKSKIAPAVEAALTGLKKPAAEITKPEKRTAPQRAAAPAELKIVKKSPPVVAVKKTGPASTKAVKSPAETAAPKKNAALTKPPTVPAKTAGKSKTAASVKIPAAVPKTKKNSGADQTIRPKAEKPVALMPAEPKRRAKKDLPQIPDKKIRTGTQKIALPVAPTPEKPASKPKTVAPETAVRNSKPEPKAKTIRKAGEIAVPPVNAKPAKKSPAVDQKIDRKKVDQKIEKTEKKGVEKIEIVIPPLTVKPIKKKIKPIGSAVVRGKTGRYDFEVFPLDAELKDGSAIYVISKRITDKGGRGHHKFVCIGQTESLLGEIKKHKRDKCIKQYKANVICLLREESETNRQRIETDLRQAHAIACNQK